MRALRLAPPLVIGILGWIGCAAAEAGAQTVRGRVAGPDGSGLAGTAITAVPAAGDTARAVLTNAAGTFVLRLPGGGRHTVRVERTGFRGFLTEPIDVAADEEVALELRLAPDEVAEVPVTILGRRRLDRDDYEQRAGFMRLLGMGRFIGEAGIDSLRAIAASDALAAVPGVVVSPSPDGPVLGLATAGGACEPALFVDGLSLRSTALDRVVPPDIVVAVEVYRGEAEIPSEFADARGCGVILVWTRRSDERSLPWRRAVVYVGMIAIGIVLFAR